MKLGSTGLISLMQLRPGTFKDFVDYVVPVLQEQGLVQKDYEGNTFRENLFGTNRGL